jgi:hypothetical protein
MLVSIVSEILDRLLQDTEPHHMVRLSIYSPHLDHEIWVPFMRADLLDVDRILIEVERVLQSNDDWLFDEFFVSFVHAPLPVGGGRFSRDFAKYLQSKRCIIQIPSDSHNMCCARAIVTSMARLDGHPQWDSIRRGFSIQLKLAEKLQQSAQIPVGTVCGLEEFKKFQQVLAPEYQLLVYSRDHFNCCIYEGKDFAEKQIYLYHAENHFSVITSMTAFLEKSFFCKSCQMGYSNKAAHVCKNGCHCCRNSSKCVFTQWKNCHECHRFFVSDACYSHHLAHGICNYIKCCPECGKTFHTMNQHTCGMKYCSYCKAQQPVSHECYIQPLKQKKMTPEQLYIFYDFECLFDETGKHIPNLCVANKVCGKCMAQPMNDFLCDCEREQFVFKGESTLNDFCEWLFGGTNDKCIAIAHNAQAYDLHLIMPYIHNLGIKPTIIQNGKKILCLEACGLKFIDSLNFFNTSLAKLPAIFGIQELQKGFFPHLFSSKENQNYQGPMPDISFFDPDGMKSEKRLEFITWYEKQHYFDYQADLLKYCISDVDILQRCCGKFRELFLQHTGNIEPFTQSVTIASACNTVYRTLFLKDGEIAIIPTQGYHTDKQSVIALCWLDWIDQNHQLGMRHAFNGGEVTVNGVKVDGFDASGRVYQFHGEFFLLQWLNLVFILLKKKYCADIIFYSIALSLCFRVLFSWMLLLLPQSRYSQCYQRSDHGRTTTAHTFNNHENGISWL